MIGARGGVGGRDHRLVAEMPRQVERELDARRVFRKRLVDAELEVEGAVEMPEHDGSGDRPLAGMHGDDFALAAFGKALGRVSDEVEIAAVLPERGAALALPAADFEREKNFDRVTDFL